jgi:glycosyltransferase involved in cell wall biosynthesis
VNEQRLGPAYNLERLLVRATGDVLFPCDQDDIWSPEKIEVLVRALEESPASGAAIGNSSLIDGAGRPLPGSLFEWAGLDVTTRKLLASDSSAAVMARRLVDRHRPKCDHRDHDRRGSPCRVPASRPQHRRVA